MLRDCWRRQKKERNDSHLGPILPPVAAVYSIGAVLTHTGNLKGTLLTEFKCLSYFCAAVREWPDKGVLGERGFILACMCTEIQPIVAGKTW